MAAQPVWFDFKYTENMGDSLLGQAYVGKVDRDGDGIADRDADGNYITDTLNYAYGDDISYGRRTTIHVTLSKLDTVRAVIGAEGFIGDYAWDVSANFGRNDSVDKLSNFTTWVLFKTNH